MESVGPKYASINPPRLFLIVSAPRSGSTMMARILDSCSNCTCEIEPLTHLAQKNKITQLVEHIQNRRIMCMTELYGQKDPAYAVYLHNICARISPIIIYLIRPKHEVAKSIYRWQDFFKDGVRAESIGHAGRIHDVYNMCIVDALRYVPDSNYIRIHLSQPTTFISITEALTWLGAEYKEQTIRKLFDARINSPEERGFV